MGDTLNTLLKVSLVSNKIARYLIDSLGENTDDIKKEVEKLFYSHDNLED